MNIKDLQKFTNPLQPHAHEHRSEEEEIRDYTGYPTKDSAFLEHVKTQHDLLAQIQRELYDLKAIAHESMHNYRDEPPNYISSYAPIRAAVTSDLIRELTMGGYGFNVVFPRTTLSATIVDRHALFNTGSKTFYVYQISISSQTTATNSYLQLLTADPSTTLNGSPNNIASSFSRKIGNLSGLAGAIISYDVTPQTLPFTPSSYIDYVEAGTNAVTEFADPLTGYVIPSKFGLQLYNASFGAAIVGSVWHIVEIPY